MTTNNKKVSEETSAGALSGAELVRIVQGGQTRRTTAQLIADLGGARKALTADRTYYVRTNGSDANDGLSNTAGGAFLTIQRAVDAVCDGLDCAGHSVVIQVADGTYTDVIELREVIGLPAVDSGGVTNRFVTLRGNPATPANVVINVADPLAGAVFFSGPNSQWLLDGLKILTNGSYGDCINMGNGGGLRIGALEIGPAIGGGYLIAAERALINASPLGALVPSITVRGPVAWSLFTLAGFCVVRVTCHINFADAIAFAGPIFEVETGSQADVASATFDNKSNATGKKYDVSENAILVAVAGDSNLPGDAAGTTAMGGARY